MTNDIGECPKCHGDIEIGEGFPPYDPPYEYKKCLEDNCDYFYKKEISEEVYSEYFKRGK